MNASLYLNNQHIVTKLACAMFRNVADREDAMQEAFLKLSQAKVPTPLRNEQGWVNNVVRNLFRDIRRKRSRQKELDSIVTNTEVHDPSYYLEGPDEEMSTLATLETMPEELRTTSSLYYLGGMDYGRIAEKLNVPEGTVASRLSKVRDLVLADD